LPRSRFRPFDAIRFRPNRCILPPRTLVEVSKPSPIARLLPRGLSSTKSLRYRSLRALGCTQSERISPPRNRVDDNLRPTTNSRNCTFAGLSGFDSTFCPIQKTRSYPAWPNSRFGSSASAGIFRSTWMRVKSRTSIATSTLYPCPWSSIISPSSPPRRV